MVNTRTPITQTPKPQTPQTQTQKRKPRGITAMGQPLNNKGGNTLVSYIGVVVRQNISIKFKHWSDDRLNAAKDIIWKDITVSFHAISVRTEILPLNFFLILIQFHAFTHNSHYQFNNLTSKSHFPPHTQSMNQ
ncbi:hypothetical protein Lal_00012801 [Lupinus albus]|nr:hypothetical protein Lal_00012801 [Lupinus albus]